MPFVLRGPFLTDTAAAAAARAVRLDCPVWLVGETGCGAYMIARELHAIGPRSGFASVRVPLRSPSDLVDRLRLAVGGDPALNRITLFVENLEHQPIPVQETVLRCLDEGLRSGGREVRFRVIAHSPPEVGEQADAILYPLRLRLATVVIECAPLSQRRADFEAIARGLAPIVAKRIGSPTAVLRAETIEALRESCRTMEELEAALARLGAAASEAKEALADPVPAGVVRTSAPHGSGFVESLVTEIAHELKNPMVTIRTFAQHLDELQSDPSLRERFSNLTEDAIGRMDGYLEELLRFSRFDPPRLERISVGTLLNRALVENPASRHVRRNGLRENAEVKADPEQAAFGLRHLIDAVSRELSAGESIMLDWRPPSELVLRAKVTGEGARINGLLPGHSGEGAGSLDVFLAQTVFRRAGGDCRVTRSGDVLEAAVRLPPLGH